MDEEYRNHIFNAVGKDKVEDKDLGKIVLNAPWEYQGFKLMCNNLKIPLRPG